jgi:hypothetical protein
MTCQCGKELQARDEHAGKRVQCPACGRALVVPTAAPEAEAEATGPKTGWELDTSKEVADRASKAGVVRHGRGNVCLLHSTGPLEHDLRVAGTAVCWNCSRKVPYSGFVFGRSGLGGTLANVICGSCNAKAWLGFSSHVTGEGTEVYLFARTMTREYTRSEEESLQAPAFTITQVRLAPDQERSRTEKDWAQTLLPAFVQAVKRKQPYQEVSDLAARLLVQAMTPNQHSATCHALRQLLAQTPVIYMQAILAEALASLRDEEAGPVVRDALARTLAVENPGDPANLPLQDLCVLTLLFGDGNGFLDAMEKGLHELATPTRACRWALKLHPKEVEKLVRNGHSIDAYESTLGGNHWQLVLPLLPLWLDEDHEKKGMGSRIFKLFHPGKKDKK